MNKSAKCGCAIISRDLLKLFTAAFLFYSLISAPFFLTAEDKGNRAYLESGPVACTGIPGIGMNSIPGYRGIYSLISAEAADGGKEKISVTAYFTTAVIPVFSEWTVLKSGSNTVYRNSSGRVFIYRHFENWTLFIDFPPSNDVSGIMPPVYGVFIEKLINQMIFFVRDGSNFVNTSFPAVIELK